MGPYSIPALFIRATVVQDYASRDELPEDPAHESLDGVGDAAFELLVRQRLARDCPLRDVAALVATIRNRYEEMELPALEAEALIRERLGEAVPTGEIDDATARLVKAVVFTALVDDLALYDDELDAVLVEAERLAEERGYRLTPACSGS